MKSKQWIRYAEDDQVAILQKDGFEFDTDFEDVPVLGIMLLNGINDIDGILTALYLVANRWKCEIGHEPEEKLSDEDSTEYINSIFEAYGYDENPEWFYGITVKDFLELEFIGTQHIGLLTQLLKAFAEEHGLFSDVMFEDKQDILENFNDDVLCFL